MSLCSYVYLNCRAWSLRFTVAESYLMNDKRGRDVAVSLIGGDAGAGLLITFCLFQGTPLS